MIINNNKPFVTIGLPVFNGEQYIESAINSILCQSFKDYELIISDNASLDRTENICRSFVAKDNRIRYFRNDTNLGAAYNFNKVFNLSLSKYFMWAAHDDMYAPDFIAKCVKVLEKNPSIVLCFSKAKFIDEQGKIMNDNAYLCDISSDSASKRFFHLVIGNYVVIEIFGLIRSNILKRTPLFKGYAAYDRVLLGELALYGPFYEIPEYLFFHREHPLRSAKVYRDLHSYNNWWVPSTRKQIVYPTWRIFFEQLATIRRVPLKWDERLRCYFKMVKWIRAKKRNMIDELITAYETYWKKSTYTQ